MLLTWNSLPIGTFDAVMAGVDHLQLRFVPHPTKIPPTRGKFLTEIFVPLFIQTDSNQSCFPIPFVHFEVSFTAHL